MNPAPAPPSVAQPTGRAHELLDAYHECDGWLLDIAPTYGPTTVPPTGTTFRERAPFPRRSAHSC